MKRLVALVIALFALAASGCGAVTSEEGSRETPGASIQHVTPPRSTGGSLEQRAVLDAALLGVQATRITKAEISAVPDGFAVPQGHDDAVWLKYEIVIPERHESVRARWHAQIATGVFRARSEALDLPLVLGVGMVIRTADGELVGGGDGVIRPPTTDGTFVPTTPRRLTELVEQGATEQAIRVLSIRFTQPNHRAVEVRVEAADPSAFVGNVNTAIHSMFGALETADQPLAEGAYIEAVDPGGKVFYTRGYSTRLAEGSSWVRPDLHSALQ